MSDKVRKSYRDFDSTRQTTSIAVDAGATTGERATLSTEMDKWSAGNPDGHVDEDEIAVPNGNSASSPVAQESTQGILEMKDAVTGQIYRERLPQVDTAKADDGTPDSAWTTTGQVANSLTVANPDHDDYATLVTAIEAVWESPNGNAGTLERLYVEK